MLCFCLVLTDLVVCILYIFKWKWCCLMPSWSLKTASIVKRLLNCDNLSDATAGRWVWERHRSSAAGRSWHFLTQRSWPYHDTQTGHDRGSVWHAVCRPTARWPRPSSPQPSWKCHWTRYTSAWYHFTVISSVEFARVPKILPSPPIPAHFIPVPYPIPSWSIPIPPYPLKTLSHPHSHHLNAHPHSHPGPNPLHALTCRVCIKFLMTV